jgi:hypothetical protein
MDYFVIRSGSYRIALPSDMRSLGIAWGASGQDACRTLRSCSLPPADCNESAFLHAYKLRGFVRI